MADVKRPPLGVRLNNPLNIRPGSPWEGLATPDEVSGFCKFTSPVWGFRAAFKNLITYHDKYGIATVREIVSRWAPPGDNNDTEAYIAAVVARTGYAPDQKLDVKKFDTAANLVRAMTVQEQGDFASWFTQEQLAEGAYRAGIVDAPPPLSKKVITVVANSASAISAAAATGSAIVQPAVMQSNDLKWIIGFGVFAVICAVIPMLVKTRAKSEG